ncbi:MAG: hypothetical protein Q4B08_04825 [Propionibacteriaceae bacterium]|nr:hypothetical protein [Propionibacteriaceae bacterium]
MTQRALLAQQEAWLRRNRLPLIIPGRRRLPRMLNAIAPFVGMILIWSLSLWLSNEIITVLTNADETNLSTLTESQLAVLSWSVLLFLASVPTAIIHQLWQRRWPAAIRYTVAGVLIALWLLLPGTAFPVTERNLMLFVAALAVYCEIPTILRWAGNCVLRSLPTSWADDCPGSTATASRPVAGVLHQ